MGNWSLNSGNREKYNFVLLWGLTRQPDPPKGVLGMTITLEVFALQIESRERLVDHILEIPFFLKKKVKV